VPIVATVADHCTEIAVERAQRWVQQGADMINLLPSRFLDPPTDQAIDHLSAVLDAVDVPVIIQFLPQAGAAVDLAAIVDLHVTHPNLTQVKIEEVPAVPGIELVQERSHGAVTSLVGWGGLEWREAVGAGAVGVQPGCSLIELYVHAQRELNAGDEAGFLDAFAPLAEPLRQWMRHVEVLIAVEKIILQRRGIIASSRCRRPSAILESTDIAFIEPLLERVG
jgi:dihydrodipicolinate synthase/N-acetylneuraminate lyase